MIPHSIIIDDFLDDFAGWRAWADSLTYESIINPVDQVAYPGIFKDMPTWGIEQRLSAVMRTPISLMSLFMRLSLEGIQVPHQAHTDTVMGEFSLMLYMNRPEDCRGGTSLVRHITGMDTDPKDEEGQKLWQLDTSKPEMWTPYTLCEMKPNRAFIFRANLMHRAEPLGGFGTNASNGRLVMTAFFNL